MSHGPEMPSAEAPATPAPWWLETGEARREALAALLADAWRRRRGPAVLATCAADGTPNAVYTRYVRRYTDGRFVVTDHFLRKTYENILGGSTGTLLFLTRDEVAYQVKGHLEYHRDGPVVQDMRRWNPAHLPRNGAVVLAPEEVYSGAERLA